MSTIIVEVPKLLYERAVEAGINVEDFIVVALSNALRLDPEVMVKARLELALRHLNEGKGLIDKDPIQASEKLYKAVEECVKALAQHYDLKDILARVNERGRWTVTELEKAVLAISRILGDWFTASWDTANYLHVWGFHEMKLDAEDVRARLPHIERIVNETQSALSGG